MRLMTDSPASLRHRVRRRLRCQLLLLGTALLIPAAAVAAGNRMIEVSDSRNTWTGKLVAMDKRSCVLFDRMGVMHRLSIRSLKSFRKVAEQYRPHSISQFRSQLLQEFPNGYELAGTTHYLVCGPKGKSQTYADLFEEVYRSVDSYYRVRGFSLTSPDTPLIAIVFGTREEFANYCREDDVRWSEQLRGYYSLKTNRIAMYDDPTLMTAVESEAGVQVASADQAARPETLSVYALSGHVAGTIIHEATHQVSYNIGIHSRVGTTPTWLCEGLATLLEAPGIRKPTGSRSRNSRTNGERLEWFRQEYSARRSSGDLARLIASDDFFRQRALDGYSFAWAFTFFLAENPTYTRKFTEYLKIVSERDPMVQYSASDRLSDFTAAFDDIARVEVDFQRFMERL
jgi:hypothetical protein